LPPVRTGRKGCKPCVPGSLLEKKRGQAFTTLTAALGTRIFPNAAKLRVVRRQKIFAAQRATQRAAQCAAQARKATEYPSSWKKVASLAEKRYYEQRASKVALGTFTSATRELCY